MPSSRTPGDQLVTQELTKPIEAPPETELAFDVSPVDGTGLQQRPFQPIEFGKPLNVLLRRVYTGRFPKKGIFGGSKPMLISSAIKDISTTSGATRALNILKPKVNQPHSVFSGVDAAEQGTILLYYSPALASSFLTISVTMSFEDFPQELFSNVSALFGGLAGIPIFLPAAGYLMGASTIVKLAGDVGNQIMNGTPALQENLQLDFSFGGGAIPQAGYWILSSGSFDSSQFKYDPIHGLLDKNQQSYAGDDPVMVLSVDGSAVDGVSSFTPLAASADILGRFFNQKDNSEVATDTILQAAKLVNDLSFRKKAEEAKQKLANLPAGASDDERKQLQDAFDTFNKNIGETRLQIASPVAPVPAPAPTPALAPASTPPHS